MRACLKVAMAAAACALAIDPAAAQTPWPQRAVKFILPAVPGGGTDTLARTLQDGLSTRLGKPVVIENRPGAAFIISTELIARATDDHTFGMIVVNTHAANVSVQDKLPYDSVNDFAWIINLTSSPNVIAVHPSVPWKRLGDLVADAKANPGKHFYATSGIAGGQHFAGELLKYKAGIDIVHVPYKGSGASLKDAVSGQIKLIFANVISGAPYLSAGTIKPLAVTSLKRSPLFPDVPTVAEEGYPDVDIEDVYSIAGPAGMSQDAVRKLHDAFRDTMLDPALQPRLKQQGMFAHLLGPQELKALIEKEIGKLREIAVRANIRGEQ